MTASALAYGIWLAYRGALPIWLPGIPLHDKVLHFLGYGLVAALVDGVLGGRTIGHRPRVSLAAAAVLTVSAIDEALQALSATRTVSTWDFLANLAGVLLCVRVARALRRRSSPPRPS